jgi:outer membrane protein OmpA-like peptidoglycan-associated protein
MAPRIVDEREHRRGLILGLTLAEVLLLLLFLLLLAMAVPLKRQLDQTHAAQEKLAEVAERLQKLRNIEALLAAARLEEAQLKKLIRAATPFASPAQMEALELFLQNAARIDPDDAPAALKRASAFLALAGKDIRPEDVSALAPVLSNADSLNRFEKAYREATRINPDDPPAALMRGIEELERAAQVASTKAQEATTGGLGEHNWPPIISLSEADGYYFATGKAGLSSEFQRKLRDQIVPLLVQRAITFRCDIIEVTGHTDEQTIPARNSNLDQKLLPVLRGTTQVSTLIPSDNAGLGLARAVAVARVLMGDQRLEVYRVLPMSAGQLIDVDEKVTVGN